MFLARSPTRSRSPATRMAPMISRKSIATGCRRAIVSVACSSISRCKQVEPRIGLHHLLGQRGVAGGERVDRVDHHFLGQAAHLGDPPLEQVEVLVVGSDGVLIRHGAIPPFSRSGQ